MIQHTITAHAIITCDNIVDATCNSRITVAILAACNTRIAYNTCHTLNTSIHSQDFELASTRMSTL